MIEWLNELQTIYSAGWPKLCSPKRLSAYSKVENLIKLVRYYIKHVCNLISLKNYVVS